MDRDMVIFVVTFLLMALFYILYREEGKRFFRVPPYVFKGLATLCAATLALYGASRSGLTADYLLAIGLFICTAADVILCFHFPWGMAAFALGHVFYCAAYVLTAPPTWVSLIAFFVLAAVALCVYPTLKHYNTPTRAAQFLAYAMVLCVMLSLAVTQRPLLFIGAALFVLSDCMLAYRMAKETKNRLYNYACLACYYLAQYLIALSLFIR